MSAFDPLTFQPIRDGSFDHLVGEGEQLIRQGAAERLGGGQVDDEIAAVLPGVTAASTKGRKARRCGVFPRSLCARRWGRATYPRRA